MADDKDDKNRTASQLNEVLTYSTGGARSTYSHLALASELAGKIRQNTMAGKLLVLAELARVLEREVADVQMDLSRVVRPTIGGPDAAKVPGFSEPLANTAQPGEAAAISRATQPRLGDEVAG